MEHTYIADTVQVFTLFFIMLGPLRILGPFARATKSLPQREVNALAWKSALVALILLIVCGLIGKGLLEKWLIPVPILELTSGLIFAFVAFKMILAPKTEDPTTSQPTPPPRPVGVATNMLVSPYGAAILIGLLALSLDTNRTLSIFMMLALVMFVDMLAMIYIRKIMTEIGAVILQMLGVVLGVLQAALALSIIHQSLLLLRAAN
ncbi:MarC family protein [Bdellovibrio sp. HCB337]|uniref:MarC family protein n=1 Tax=Bdellovibrio sp. HCB337 TaxID=3394358 RepID=UPI0039A53D3F